MQIASQIKDILKIVFDFLSVELPNLPFSLLDVWIYIMIGSVLITIYHKVMGDD